MYGEAYRRFWSVGGLGAMLFCCCCCCCCDNKIHTLVQQQRHGRQRLRAGGTAPSTIATADNGRRAGGRNATILLLPSIKQTPTSGRRDTIVVPSIDFFYIVIGPRHPPTSLMLPSSSLFLVQIWPIFVDDQELVKTVKKDQNSSSYSTELAFNIRIVNGFCWPDGAKFADRESRKWKRE